MIQLIFSVASTVVNIFSILIFVRILLSWFRNSSFYYSTPYNILCQITDPYINWFKRFTFLRAGNIDLSPIVAIAVLSIVNSILSTIAHYGKITIGIILYLGASTLWQAISFIFGFIILILILMLVLNLTGIGANSRFYNILGSISQSIIYKTNSFFFKKRILRFTTSLIISIVIFIVSWAALGAAFKVLGRFLLKSPI